jgi:hypothetical protein
VINHLEQSDLCFFFCRLCECPVPDCKQLIEETSKAINDHFASKAHVKIRDENGIKEVEENSFAIMQVVSTPGEVTDEVRKEKEKALKRQSARLKK